MNIKSLISEDNDNVSMGRVAFWLLFIISMFFWITDKKYPNTMYDIFAIIVLYNFSKKGIEVISKYVDNTKTIITDPTNPTNPTEKVELK
jgi:hypothetical protein